MSASVVDEVLAAAADSDMLESASVVESFGFLTLANFSLLFKYSYCCSEKHVVKVQPTIELLLPVANQPSFKCLTALTLRSYFNNFA